MEVTKEINDEYVTYTLEEGYNTKQGMVSCRISTTINDSDLAKEVLKEHIQLLIEDLEETLDALGS